MFWPYHMVEFSEMTRRFRAAPHERWPDESRRSRPRAPQGRLATRPVLEHESADEWSDAGLAGCGHFQRAASFEDAPWRIFQSKRPIWQRDWRSGMGVEPTQDGSTAPQTVFEDRAGHRTGKPLHAKAQGPPQTVARDGREAAAAPARRRLAAQQYGTAGGAVKARREGAAALSAAGARTRSAARPRPVWPCGV